MLLGAGSPRVPGKHSSNLSCPRWVRGDRCCRGVSVCTGLLSPGPFGRSSRSVTRTRPSLHARGTAPLLPPTLDLLWQGRRLQPAGLNPAAPLTGTKSHFKKMSQSRSRIASEPFPIIMMFPSEHQRSYGRAGREPAAPVHGQGWGTSCCNPRLGTSPQDRNFTSLFSACFLQNQ